MLAALVACAPGAARAISLGRGGIGQVLLYPYYTTRAGQDTLVSITNRSAVAKAVQARVLEGYNGREVLSFVLYLSAHDGWTATIGMSPQGGAMLRTNDSSCTVPAIPATGLAFASDGYDGTGALPADGGPRDIDRTREGSIEFIAGADIVPGSATDVAITHVQNGTPGEGLPADCSAIDTSRMMDDITVPTGGIFGAGTIVNVAQGTFFAYDADALNDFTDVPLFSSSAPNGPTLADAHSGDASTPGGAIAYLSDATGKAVAIEYETAIDAVSAVLMADTVENEFFVDPALGAGTDWILTFPTKRFYVDAGVYPSAPRAPFVEAFDEAADGQSNIAFDATIYDREENHTDTEEPPGGCGFICPGFAPLAFHYEVNDLMFLPGGTADGTPSGVFGSVLSTNFEAYPFAEGAVAFGNAGWLSIALDGAVEPHSLPGGISDTAAPISVGGLPVIGFMVYNVVNAHARGNVLANYSGAFRHRTTVSCNDSRSCSANP